MFTRGEPVTPVYSYGTVAFLDRLGNTEPNVTYAGVCLALFLPLFFLVTPFLNCSSSFFPDSVFFLSFFTFFTLLLATLSAAKPKPSHLVLYRQ
ncbi:hypothetical protein DER45DRAFT_318901 [Fusarium avenaceum]|nr:hypothetical protein DER45DRAFT_318901 [Fusarium avenaceum]